MEKITNVIQGKNPGEYPYSNYFCNQIKLKNDDSTEIPCTGNGILMENIPNRLYLTPKNGNEYKFSNTPVDNLDELDGLNFTYQIILNPACRRAGVIEPLGTLADTTCVSGQTQDTHTMEIIVLVNWDPPGPLTTAQYQISTLFTEFIEFPPAP